VLVSAAGYPTRKRLEVVMICPNSPSNATRGLAIWAVGQMGMIDVLDEIVKRGEELSHRDAEELSRIIGELR
jgi:hypothetical protein